MSKMGNGEFRRVWHDLYQGTVDDGGIEPGVIDEDDLINHGLEYGDDTDTTEGLASLIAEKIDPKIIEEKSVHWSSVHHYKSRHRRGAA